MTDLAAIDWAKSDGLVPAIVQDASSGAVLMLAYMNREALAATLASRRVTFWSRSKQRLWTKGESRSGLPATPGRAPAGVRLRRRPPPRSSRS